MIALYCRKSKKVAEGTDKSIPTQIEEGKEFALKNGFDFNIYVDEGISGAKDEISERPEFAQMLMDMKTGDVTKVWCIDQSRLERSPLVWQLFQMEVLKYKCEYYPNGQKTDLKDPNVQFMTAVISAANKMYTQLTSKKVKLAMQRNAKVGKSHGMCAYGFYRAEDKTFLINEKESKIVKRIFELSLSGIGGYTIAKTLNKESVPTKFNSYSGDIKRKDVYTNKVTRFKKENVKWRGNVIIDMITNPIYKGKKKLNDGFIDVPVIIKEELWGKTQKNLKVNKKNVGPKTHYHYLLNGIIHCGNCGGESIGVKKVSSGAYTYRCKKVRYTSGKNCASRGINIMKLETFVIQHLFKSKTLKELLSKAPRNTSIAVKLRGQLEDRSAQFKKIEVSIERILKFLDDAVLGDDATLIEKYKTYTKKSRELEQQIIDLKKNLRVAEDSARNEKAKSLIESYTSEVEFDAIKKMVHSLIERIEVHYGGKPSYFMVKIKYKGFEEETLWNTDIFCFKWMMLGKYTGVGAGKVQLEEDRRMELGYLEYLGVTTGNEYISGLDREKFAKGLKKERLLTLMQRGEIKLAPNEIDKEVIKYTISTEELDQEIAKVNPFSKDYAGTQTRHGSSEIITIDKSKIVDFDQVTSLKTAK